MAIADTINSIRTHLTADYESLENIGAELENVDKNIENIASVVNEIYDNLPKTTGEGTSLSLNTIKGKMNTQVKGDTSQNGTPTPDTPIDVEVVTGTQEVKVGNVNLCENATTNANAGAYANILFLDMDLKPNTTYTISFKGVSGNKIYLNENITTSQYFTCTGSRESRTFTTTSTLDKTNTQQYKPDGWIIFKNQSANTETPNFVDVQAEYGSTATPYIPHQEQTQIVSLGDIELCKIGTYQDYIYKSNGNWYKKEQIGKTRLTGTAQTWYSSITSINEKKRYYTDSFMNIIVNPSSVSVIANILNNYYKPQVASSQGSYGGKQGISVDAGGRIYINDDNYQDNLEGWKTWLNGVTCELYYALQTANDIQITNETLISQLDNLQKLKSYNGVTNINCSGNLSAILSVSALKGE